MATFTNPQPPGYGPVTNDPDWLKQSQGYSKSDAMAAGKTGFGEALANIGSIVDKGIKAVDSGIEESMKEEARRLIDPTRQDNTVINLAAAEGQPVLPTAAAAKVRTLAKNEQRVAAGGMSEVDYNIQLLSIVKDLRSKYPGYTEQIDQTVSRLTGVNPANALRSQALSQLTESQTSAKAKQDADEKWYESVQKYAYLFVPANTPKEVVIANRAALEPKIGMYRAADERMDYEKKEIGLNGAKDELSKTRLNKIAIVEAQGVTQKMWQTAEVNGPKFMDLYNQQRKIVDAGGIPDKEAVAALQGRAQDMRHKLSMELDAYFAKPIGPGLTLGNTLSPEQIKNIKETQLGQMDSLIAMIGKGKDGFAAIGANLLSQSNAEVDYKLGEKYSTIKIIGSLNRQGGSDTASHAARMTPQFLTDTQDAMLNTRLLYGNVTGNPADKADPMHKVIQTGAAAKPGGTMAPKEQKLLLNQFLTTLQDKNPVIAEQSLDVLYSDPTWFEKLPTKERHKVYLQMTSPDVTKRIQALEAEKPGSMDKYVAWLNTAYRPVFTRSVAELQGVMTGGQHNITVDPKTLNISVAVKPEILGTPSGPRDERYSHIVKPRDAAIWNAEANNQKYLQQFNQGINTLMPVLEAKFGPEGAKQYIGQLLQQMGYNPNAPQQPGLMSVIGSAIKGFDQKVQDQIDSVKPGPVDVDPYGRLKNTDVSGSRKNEFRTEGGSVIDGTRLAKKIDDTESKGGDYNVALGNRKVPFTEMSIDEVLDWQKKDKAQTGAAAAPAGRTQIVRRTLESLKKDMGLTGKEKFDEDMQDQMRDVLLERRGLSKFLDGEITAKQFVTGLRNEWEGLQKVSDRELLQTVMELSVSLGKQRPAGR
jgi:hypothetical protein